MSSITSRCEAEFPCSHWFRPMTIDANSAQLHWHWGPAACGPEAKKSLLETVPPKQETIPLSEAFRDATGPCCWSLGGGAERTGCSESTLPFFGGFPLPLCESCPRKPEAQLSYNNTTSSNRFLPKPDQVTALLPALWGGCKENTRTIKHPPDGFPLARTTIPPTQEKEAPAHRYCSHFL